MRGEIAGAITILFRGDNKELQKDLAKAEKDLERFAAKEQQLTKQKMKFNLDIKEAEANLQKIDAKQAQIKQKMAEKERINAPENLVNDAEYQKLISDYDILISKSEVYETKLFNARDNVTRIDGELAKNIEKQEETKQNIDEIQSKISKIDLSKFKEGIEDASKSLSKVIEKVGKYALAVFGVRSAYMAVRGALNTISQNDEQLKIDIEYMKNALAYTLEPIIRQIVEWAKQLMFYVGYILKAWTGQNIWENANKSLKGANKEAKKLSKTLLGFDELNILGSDESSGGGGGVSVPSFDLNAPEDIPVPGWLQWIVDNKELILSVLSGIAAGLLAIKLGLDLIPASGIALFVFGIVYAVQAFLKYLKEPSWENFGKIVTGIGIAVAGVAIIFEAWPIAVAGAIVAIIGIIISNWDKIKTFFLGIVDWITSHIDEIGKKFGLFGQFLSILFAGLLKEFTTFLDDVFSGAKDILDGIIKIFRGDFVGGISQIFGGLGKIMMAPFHALWEGAKVVLNFLIDGLNKMINGLNSFKIDIPDWVPFAGGKTFGFRIPQIPRLASGGIVDVPRTGVNIGGAITGEAGREGVLPLTNKETMAELGKEIGQWVTVKINLTNEMDGRVLNNRLETIRNNNSFTRNGVR